MKELNATKFQLNGVNEQMQFIAHELQGNLKELDQKPHEAVRELVLRVGALDQEQKETNG